MLTKKFIRRLIILKPFLTFNAEAIIRILSVSKNRTVKFSFNHHTKEVIFLEKIDFNTEFILEYFNLNEERKEKLKKLNG